MGSSASCSPRAPRCTGTPRSSRCTRTTGSIRSPRTASRKRTGEDLLGYYQRRASLSWIALRFFNVYGPGQKTTAYYTSVINHFVNRIKNGEPPVIDGKGEQSMDFIHVHDIARSVVLALKPRRTTCRSISAPGIDTTIADLAESSSTLWDADVKPIFNPRDVLVSRRAADTTRANEVLGFEPTIAVEDGMADLIRNGG